MSKSISGSRAWGHHASKCLSCFVLAAIASSGQAPASGAEASTSRWSTANPPTPAAVDAHTPIQAASQTPAAAEHTPEGADAGLRRLPPVEDTQPTPQSETAGQEQPAHAVPGKPDEPAASHESAARSAPPTRAEPSPAAPVDWTNPHVVVGPERVSRTVSHEEMISTPPEFDARASRFSRIASAASDADQDQVAATSGSRYSEPPTPSLQPVSSLRQPVFARVFDETVSPDDVTEQPRRDVPPSERPVAQVSETLSPIFACRLLGLPATQERAPASQPSDRTTTR